MAMTLAEVLGELESLKHRRAVCMELVEHLSKFVDKEVRHADHAILAEGCVTGTVPQSVLMQFIDDIEERDIAPLNDRIEKLEKLHVYEDRETEDDQGPEPKKSATRRGPTRLKSIKKPQGSRSSNRGPKPSDSGSEPEARGSS